VQGARLRRCRRTGAGAVMLWVASVSSSLSSSPPPPLSGAATAEGKQGRGWLGFRAAAVGVVIHGAGVRVRLRPRLFGVHAGTRGGIAVRRERG
jgi:hypothetical protein